MTSVIQQLAALDEDKVIIAFERILAERPSERTELIRSFRTDLPDLYQRWLLHQAGGLKG
jgi:hypothetical protein